MKLLTITQHNAYNRFLLSANMSGKFEPKAPVNLDPPKDDPISLAELGKANGKSTWIKMNTCLYSEESPSHTNR